MTRPAFNRAAWEGRKPLVAPAPFAPDIDLGAVVWERQPGDANYVARGGLVVATRPDSETSEKVVTILTGRVRNGQRVCSTFELAASQLDASLTQPPKADVLHRHVRGICAHIGAKSNAHVTGFDRTLMEYAVLLLHLADEMAHEVRLSAAKAREAS